MKLTEMILSNPTYLENLASDILEEAKRCGAYN